MLFGLFSSCFQDLKGSVEQVAKFLGYSFSDDVINAIVDHCTFANMKKNPMCNPDSIINMFLDASNVPKDAPPPTSFMRKGMLHNMFNLSLCTVTL